MIRTVIRHLEEAEGVYLGDFEPAAIPALVALIRTTPIYDAERGYCQLISDTEVQGGPTQLIESNHGTTPRIVYEVIVETMEPQPSMEFRP